MTEAKMIEARFGAAVESAMSNQAEAVLRAIHTSLLDSADICDRDVLTVYLAPGLRFGANLVHAVIYGTNAGDVAPVVPMHTEPAS